MHAVRIESEEQQREHLLDQGLDILQVRAVPQLHPVNDAAGTVILEKHFIQVCKRGVFHMLNLTL